MSQTQSLKLKVQSQSVKLKAVSALSTATLAIIFPLLSFANGDDHNGKNASEAVSVREERDIREGISGALNVAPVPLSVGTPGRLDFYVTEKPAGTPVLLNAFDVTHTKLMHGFGVRDDLSGFFHIFPSPTSTPGHMVAERVFDAPGRYKVWSEFSVGGHPSIISHPIFDVRGDGAQMRDDISFGRNVITGNYQVSLHHAPTMVKNYPEEITFELRTLTGNGVRLDDYLGAPLHVIAIKKDLTVFLHLHAEEVAHTGAVGDAGGSLVRRVLAHGQEGDTIDVAAYSAHAEFPSAGPYKLFVRFHPAGAPLPPDDALTASFWIEVKDSAISKTAAWWILLSASLVLIAGLSFGVSKFIKPRV